MPKFHKDLTGADLHDPKPHNTSHEKGGSDEIKNLAVLTDDVEIGDINKGIIMSDINGSGAKARLRFIKENGAWQMVLEDV